MRFPFAMVVALSALLTAVGYGLVKLDKDSNILWSYPAGVHHDVDVGAAADGERVLGDRGQAAPDALVQLGLRGGGEHLLMARVPLGTPVRIHA